MANHHETILMHVQGQESIRASIVGAVEFLADGSMRIALDCYPSDPRRTILRAKNPRSDGRDHALPVHQVMMARMDPTGGNRIVIGYVRMMADGYMLIELDAYPVVTANVSSQSEMHVFAPQAVYQPPPAPVRIIDPAQHAPVHQMVASPPLSNPPMTGLAFQGAAPPMTPASPESGDSWARLAASIHAGTAPPAPVAVPPGVIEVVPSAPTAPASPFAALPEVPAAPRNADGSVKAPEPVR